MLKDYKSILLFDIETNGLKYNKNKIIEFGGILLEQGENDSLKVVREVNELVKVDEPLPSKIIEITNITDTMLNESGISEQELVNIISELIDKDTLLVAYNCQFDISFIVDLLKRYGIEFNNNAMLDPMAIYRDRYSYPHKLLNAVETYKVNNDNAHRAISDCYATLEVLKSMALEQDNIEVYVNKIGYIAKYGVSGINFPYVKYIPQYFNGQRAIETEMSNVSNKDVDDTEAIYVLSTRGLSGDKRYFAADGRIKGLDKPLLFSRTIFKLMTLKECNNAIFVANREYNVSNKEKQERLKNLNIERVVFEEIE